MENKKKCFSDEGHIDRNVIYKIHHINILLLFYINLYFPLTLSLSLSLSLSLAICPYCQSLVEVPLHGIHSLHWDDECEFLLVGEHWLPMWMNPLEDFVNEFIFSPEVERSMSCVSYLNSLWDGGINGSKAAIL